MCDVIILVTRLAVSIIVVARAPAFARARLPKTASIFSSMLDACCINAGIMQQSVTGRQSSRMAAHATAQQQRPPHPAGRRRGKALLNDVNLKPAEADDMLLDGIARDLRPVEVSGSSRLPTYCS